MPKNKAAKINLDKIKTLKIFKFLKDNKISDFEMLKTFNCGVGFCLIINKKTLKKLKIYFQENLNHIQLVELLIINRKK